MECWMWVMSVSVLLLFIEISGDKVSDYQKDFVEDISNTE